MIIFESHSTSLDNEKKIASGHLDVALSEKGMTEAEELGRRYALDQIKVVLCSDLIRSYHTARIAFEKTKSLIIPSPSLREWNYGCLNGSSSEEVEKLKLQYMNKAFPEGESLREGITRVLEYLDQIKDTYSISSPLLIVGHRLVFYALEYRYKKKKLEYILKEQWQWMPARRYE